MRFLFKAVLLGILFWVWATVVTHTVFTIDPKNEVDLSDIAQMTEYAKEILNKGR